ncbi:Trypanosomal VSG domain containing protein, putative [Trypanosoma equiperdum]|uniref:Trypanosomal VSG domain containing protein, putative n=1 Tax=Trypanosoma equiperdum TaxID=5694 RepID=A0A1G4I9R4_TRYEQ|nr:Trypanosomal VSG domain containing protein, putative [Trypanosoma equiperdum]
MREKLDTLVREAKSYIENGRLDDNNADLKAKANQALYGSSEATDETDAEYESTRTNMCGKANGQGTAKAGQSIRDDMLCLCAKASASPVNNVCCKDCDPTRPASWSEKTAGKTIFKHLKNKCRDYAPKLELSKANAAGSALALYKRISRAQSTATNKHFILGKLDGNGASGCDGQTTANHGVCVVNNTASETTADKPVINWMQAVFDAAAASDKLQAAKQHSKTWNKH